MSILKTAIKKMLLSLGYELTRSTEPRVGFKNFANLAQAYEERLNEATHLIPANEIRIQLLAELMGTPPGHAYFIVQALAKCQAIDGDVCEFGVAEGATSALIANEIASSNSKILHLFDSFEGLPRPSAKDTLKDDIFSLGSMEAYTGMLACPEEMVRARLKAISFPSRRFVIHKGFIEDLIHRDRKLPTRVCFAFVDLDFYEPIKLALEFLHRATPCGAVIIVHDYDFFSTGARGAVDDFLDEKNASHMVYECLVPDTRYGHLAVLTRTSGRVDLEKAGETESARPGEEVRRESDGSR